MERVLQSYENDMRPYSFQCCATELNGHITGFRMSHARVTPDGSDGRLSGVQDGVDAATGCIGNCENHCYEEVTGFDPLSALQFVFQSEKDTSQVNKIRNIVVSGLEDSDQVSLCGTSYKPSNHTRSDTLKGRGVPVGFEYTFDEDEMAFLSLHLIRNSCPEHPSHLGVDSQNWQLSGEGSRLSLSQLSQMDFPEDADGVNYLYREIKVFLGDGAAQLYDRVYKRYTFDRIFYYEDEFDAPLNKFKIGSLSHLLYPQENPPGYLQIVDQQQTAQNRLDVLFEIIPSKAPQVARVDPLTLEISYGNFFQKIDTVQAQTLDRNLTYVGNSSESTCIVQKQVLDYPSSEIEKRQQMDYKETKMSNTDLIEAQRTSQDQLKAVDLFMCCVGPSGAVASLEFSISNGKKDQEKFAKFVAENADYTCSYKSQWWVTASDIRINLVYRKNDTLLEDVQLFKPQEGTFESICGKTAADTVDSASQKFSLYEEGVILGVAMQRMLDQNDADFVALSKLYFVIDRCFQNWIINFDIDINDFSFEIQQDEPAQVVEFEDLPLRPLYDDIFLFEPIPVGIPQFQAVRYCEKISYECYTYLEQMPTEISLLVEFLSRNETRLPAWDVKYWDNNRPIAGLLLQKYKVTEDYQYWDFKQLFMVQFRLDIGPQLAQDCFLADAASSQTLSYTIRQQKAIRVDEKELICSNETNKVLQKVHMRKFTMITATDIDSGKDLSSLLQKSADLENLYFSTTDATLATVQVEQLTTIYFGGPTGLTNQIQGNLQTETLLESVVFEAKPLQIQVMSCDSIELMFEYGIQTLELVRNSGTTSRQFLPPLQQKDGSAYPESCKDQLTAEVSLDNPKSPVQKLISGATAEMISVESPTKELVGIYEAVLLLRIQNDKVVLQQPFLIQIKEDLVVWFNEPPVFQGYPNLSQLPLWNIAQGVLESYTLPPVIDPDESDPLMVSFELIKPLEDCECFQLSETGDITVEVPLELQIPSLFQIGLTLSDNYASSNYTIPVFVMSAETTNSNKTDGNANSTSQNSTQTDDSLDSTQGLIQREVGQNKTFEGVTLTIQELFKPVLVDQDEEEFFFVASNYQLSGQEAYKESLQRCVPMSTKSTTRGQVFLQFANPIALRNSTSATFLQFVKESGAIQVQVLSTVQEDSKKFSFDWIFNQTDPNELMFQLLFDEPSLVSSVGNYLDAVRITFLETRQFLKCVKGSSEQLQLRSLRDLQEQYVDEDGEFIPENTETTVLVPQQKDPLEVDSVDVFIEDFGNTTETLTLTSISLSSAVKLPMQFVWGGVNAVQLISHLPLNQVNFPSNTYEFFNYLAQVVSFDIFPPTENFEFDFSETQPHSIGFELLDYESINFYDSIGSISLIFLFILARIILQPLFVGIIWLCFGRHRLQSLASWCWLQWSQISNIWIRFMLETFLELTIASLLGVNLEREILSLEMTTSDLVALRTAQVTIGVGSLFILFSLYATVIAGRPLMKIRRNQLRNFESRLANQKIHEQELENQFLLRTKSLVSEKETKRRTQSMTNLEVLAVRPPPQMQLSYNFDRRMDISSLSIASSSSEEVKTHRSGDLQIVEKSPKTTRPLLNSSTAKVAAKCDPKAIAPQKQETINSAISTTSINKENPVEFPGWYAYIAEFFIEIDHKMYLNLQINSIFLIRRVLFVMVALYLTASPAAQALIFIVCSMVQSVIILGRWPYTSTIGNVMETVNELTVLAIGYHVLILLFVEVSPQLRLELGVSMMIIITTLILITGLVWLYKMLLKTHSWLRKCLIKRRFKRKMKSLQTQREERHRSRAQKQLFRQNTAFSISFGDSNNASVKGNSLLLGERYLNFSNWTLPEVISKNSLNSSQIQGSHIENEDQQGPLTLPRRQKERDFLAIPHGQLLHRRSSTNVCNSLVPNCNISRIAIIDQSGHSLSTLCQEPVPDFKFNLETVGVKQDIEERSRELQQDHEASPKEGQEPPSLMSYMIKNPLLETFEIISQRNAEDAPADQVRPQVNMESLPMKANRRQKKNKRSAVPSRQRKQVKTQGAQPPQELIEAPELPMKSRFFSLM